MARIEKSIPLHDGQELSLIQRDDGTPEIILTKKDTFFGGAMTSTVLDGSEHPVETVQIWNLMEAAFSAGKREQQQQIKKALGV